jgi:tRNA threonylcarbamoyladenosine biosynthesis protein TsaB
MTPEPCLAIEFATEQASVAVLRGTAVFTCESAGAPSRQVYGWIDALLASGGLTRSGLAAVAFSAGPGSFTGLRVAAAVAQSLAHALGVPVLQASTLAVLAMGAHRVTGHTECLVALDARMGGIYAGHYRFRDGRPEAVRPDVLVPVASRLPLPAGEFAAAGPGFAAAPGLLGEAGLPDHCLPDLRPRASDLLALVLSGTPLVEQVNAAAAVPVYLRDRVTR